MGIESPTTNLGDLSRLALRLASPGAARQGRGTIIRHWAAATASKRGSNNLLIDLGVKQFLLIGDPAVSTELLAEPPSAGDIVTGDSKRKAMKVLAPNAVTNSDGADWSPRRRYNERVLATPTRVDARAAVIARTERAFANDVRDLDAIRGRMRHVMEGTVFGDRAVPASIAGDVEWLYAAVQSPVRRVLLGPIALFRRRRLYRVLRRQWNAAADDLSLIGAAHAAGGLADQVALEQIPHWMFTFTGSGTDLLARTLILIANSDAVRRQAAAESARWAAEANHDRPPDFIRACVLESAQLWPPVTRTFRQSTRARTVGNTIVPPDVEIALTFPPFAAADARRFDPARWLAGRPTLSFDPFLGGARSCPGQELIVLVCSTAIATILARRPELRTTPAIDVDHLSSALDAESIQFH